MATNIIMPQLGESVVEGTVSRWLKKVGETVSEFEPLVEISTDKVETEIPAPATGILLAIHVGEGQTVERGTLLAVIGQADEQTSRPQESDTQQANGSHPTHTAPLTATPSTPASSATGGGARYSPVVARMAAEHQIDLQKVSGTGMGGRVTKKDIEAYLANSPQPQTSAQSTTSATLEPWEQPGEGDLFKPTDEVYKKARESLAKAETGTATPQATPAPMAPTSTLRNMPVPAASAPADLPGEMLPISTMRRVIAEHMVRSKLHTAPHVTTVFEIDMGKTMAHWKANEQPFAEQGLRLTLTAYFMTAIARAAVEQPTLNSRWTEGGIFRPHVVNIGMAVALSEGLIVPVIKNAQDLNLSGMARQVNDLATRARGKALRPDDTSGGTITLTNHGVSGSLLATPIINQPQTAIVGVGAVTKRVVVVESEMGDAMAIRPMMYATLTFDHRVADGAVADGFMRVFRTTLENWT
jgi:2-oxoglutarate dehydrogenase E2 component (dihydrolipoamide succinyltransferase)